MAEEAAPQVPGGQDPAQQSAPAAPAQTSAPAPQLGAGPWTEDIRGAFTDPQVAAQVDQFLRGKVQPRMTQLEQQLSEASQARALMDAFDENPNAAYVAVSRQLYGDEYANALEAQLLGEPQQPAQQQQLADPYAALPPEVMEVVQERQQAKQQAEYDAAKSEFLGSSPAYADIDSDLFDPFVGAAETWEEAVDMYRSWAARYAQANGGAPPAAEPAPTDAPPPVLGGQGGAPAVVPTQPHYDSIYEAIDDAFKTGQLGPLQPPAPPTVK